MNGTSGPKDWAIPVGVGGEEEGRGECQSVKCRKGGVGK